MNAATRLPPRLAGPLFSSASCLLAFASFSALPVRAEDVAIEAGGAFALRSDLLSARGDNHRPTKSLIDMIFLANFEGLFASCFNDSDLDGLADCVETNTGRFVSVLDTGTDPRQRDTDGDGLFDGEEVLGSNTGLDLRALGVSPVHKDLLIEYDWFDSDFECGPHSQRPSAESMERLHRMFAESEVENPDGVPGIRLFQDYGQPGAQFTGGNRVDGYSAILPGTFGTTYRSIKRDNFDPARLGYFRYVLMVHRYNGSMGTSSGFAEIVGDDAIVSLQCQNSISNVTQTIAHEVGHLLGLNHGGFEACNGKPNYNSLMNYRFQFSGVDLDCDATGDSDAVDYSRHRNSDLNESALEESAGTCGAPSIDWNFNGQIDLMQALDLNPGNDLSCGGALSHLKDFDDWKHITFYGVRDFSGTLKSIQSETACPGIEL